MGSTYDPLVGTVLDERYEILAKLARGGMATVYRARDQRLTRVVAVKVMRTDLGEDDEFAAKFDREARAAATINHPAVVGVFDQGTSSGQPYIVMEFVEGETLRRQISREAPLPPEAALELLEPIASALAAAHECGLVHRDIKPENVLISTRGQVKVADFGLARQVTSPQMTATGVLVGTASYLPPELVTHSRPDSRSDVYSAGVVLFEMLTGQKPHVGENNYQIAYRHVNVDIEPPSQRLATTQHRGWRIPDYVDALVLACTTRDPEARLADGRIMLERVREARHQLAETGSSDAPALAERLLPADTRHGDSTQQISPHPTARPRPVAAAVGAAAASGSLGRNSRNSSSRPLATPVPPPSRHRPGTASVRHAPEWEPVQPRSAISPVTRQASPPRSPVPPRSEDSGRQPRLSRTPVFPNLSISNDPVHKRRRGIALLLALLLVTAGAGFGSWWWMSGRFTTVPSIAQVSEAQAQEAASANDVRMETVTEYSEDVAAGLVISTDPAQGTRVLRGASMTVRISQGPERFDMPTVVGSTLEAARAALASQNLSLGTVTEIWSAEVASGTVTKASVAPGAKLKRSTAVDLEVSKGPQPIPITNFTGRKADTAVAELKRAGFEVKVSTENSRQVPAGDVISQNPATGNGVKGDQISLVKSLGPVMVEIPDLRYKGQDEAEKALKSLGFEVEIRYVTDFPLPLKLVAGTEPGRGNKLPEGSKVVLLVS